MNIINFNEEELTQIEEFLKAATEINNIYNNLYQLEVSGQIDSNDYKKQLEILKESIKNENENYQNANLTFQKSIKIIELLSITQPTLKNDNLTYIIEQQDNNIIIRRVINILLTKTINYKDYAKNCLSTGFFEDLKDIEIPIDKEEIYTNFHNEAKVEEAINNDITSIFLSILQEELIKYPKYREKLLKAKYNTIFINKNIEELLIFNNLEITNIVYLNSKLINDLTKTSPIIYETIKSVEINIKIMSQIKKILNTEDESYTHENASISLIINKCYIRALLSLMNEEELQELNKKIDYLLNNKPYKETYQVSEKAITSCLKKAKKDKERVHIISITN